MDAPVPAKPLDGHLKMHGSTATARETLSQSPSKAAPDPQNCERANVDCFKPLFFF